MSSADRRKSSKAKKERELSKKRAQAHDRLQGLQDQAFEFVRGNLREKVTSGVARVALCTVPRFQTILAAMWTKEGVHMGTYQSKDKVALSILAKEVTQQVGLAECAEFIAAHVDKVFDMGDGELALSIIPWKAGEGPNAAISTGRP